MHTFEILAPASNRKLTVKNYCGFRVNVGRSHERWRLKHNYQVPEINHSFGHIRPLLGIAAEINSNLNAVFVK